MGFTREWFLAVKIICIRYISIQDTQRKSFCNCPLYGGRRADDFPEVRKIVNAGATSKPVKEYELTRYVNSV